MSSVQPYNLTLQQKKRKNLYLYRDEHTVQSSLIGHSLFLFLNLVIQLTESPSKYTGLIGKHTGVQDFLAIYWFDLAAINELSLTGYKLVSLAHTLWNKYNSPFDTKLDI